VVFAAVAAALSAGLLRVSTAPAAEIDDEAKREPEPAARAA
jgi:hypothetical protein